MSFVKQLWGQGALQKESSAEQRCLQVFEGEKAFALKPHNSFLLSPESAWTFEKVHTMGPGWLQPADSSQDSSGAGEGHKELDGGASPRFGKDGIHLWTVWERNSGRDLHGYSLSLLPEATQPSVSLHDFSLYHSRVSRAGICE